MQPRVPEPVSERAFVGRDAELAAVAACVDAAVAGQAQVVWIEGAAGSGKTALLREVLARLPAACQLLQAEADELAGDVPLHVVGRFAPISAGSAFAAGMELLALLGTAQDAGPVAAVVEDLHWADAASCQALLTVARRLDRDKVVVLISSRPGPRADGWERFCRDPGRCLRVVLGGLSVDEISELAHRTGKALSPRHAERLHRHTGGHALYVRTLLSELSRTCLLQGGRAAAESGGRSCCGGGTRGSDSSRRRSAGGAGTWRAAISLGVVLVLRRTSRNGAC